MHADKNVVYIQHINFFINNFNNYLLLMIESDKYTPIIINYKNNNNRSQL